MNFSRPYWLVISMFAAVGAVLGGAQSARASCAANSDCPKGFTCEVVGGTACAQPACAEGETCPEPLPCRTEETKECRPGPCDSDTDCASGMVCFTQTSEECSGGAAVCTRYADGGVSCGDAAIAEPVCKTVTESACMPKYLAPCVKDADCGEGFQCKELMMGWCSGSTGSGVGGSSGSSSGAGGAGGGTAGSSGAVDAGSASSPELPSTDAGPADASCGSEGTGKFRCEMQEITCTADSMCPSGWTCEESGDTVVSSCAVSDSADAAVTCEDAGAPEPAPKQCKPPYYDLYGSRGSYDAALGAEQSGSAGKTGSTVGAAGSGGTTSPPWAAGAGGSHASDASADESAYSKSDDEHSGCQVALGHSGSTSSAVFLAGLLGLLALRRRRLV